jgi:hypothetical protein
MTKLIIVSGGQTGVDRAALDAALAHAVPYEGWCPLSGWAEDCPVPPGIRRFYPDLKETPLRDPTQRTEWNVRDADASLILTDGRGTASSRGSELAEHLAGRYSKPLKLVDIDRPGAAADVIGWLTGLLAGFREVDFRLAIGGPRQSEVPRIYDRSMALLTSILGRMRQ